MKLVNIILPISILLFISCQNENEVNKKVSSKVQFTNTMEMASNQDQIENQIEGKYLYSLGWSYSESLDLKKDNTFLFFTQGYTGRDSTEGTWKKEGNKISLSSFPKFKNIPKSEIIPGEEGESESKVKVKSKLEISPYLEIITLDIKNNHPIYLENWELVFNDDQLVEIAKDEPKENRLYVKNKN